MARARVAALSALVLAVAMACQAGSNAAGPSPTAVNNSTALFHDNLNAVATGRPSVPDRSVDIAHIHNYTLATSFPVTPADAVAYRLDQTGVPSPQTVGLVWGIKDPAQNQIGQVAIGPITYFPDAGAIEYNRPPNPQSVRVDPPGHLSHPPADAASAIAMTRDFLAVHGLFTTDEMATMTSFAQLFTYPPPNLPLWVIRIHRVLGGVPDYGFWAPGATLQAAQDGRIDSLLIVRRTISGAEPVKLIDPAVAWQQVIQGHWYAADGIINNGRLEIAEFRADSAQLCYRESEVGTAEQWLVPMWCFGSKGYFGDSWPDPESTLRLYYPALTPGTFDWTMPNRN